jgi:hypothetical protein
VHQRTLVDSRYASALVKLVEQFTAATATSGAATRADGQQQGGQAAAAAQEGSMQSVFYALMDLAGFTGAAPAGGLQGGLAAAAAAAACFGDCWGLNGSRRATAWACPQLLPPSGPPPLLLNSAQLRSALLPAAPSACALPPGPLPTLALAEGGGKASRGRELHGTAVIPRVLSFLVLRPQAPGAAGAAPGPQGSRHAATSTLLEYLVNSRPNCELLGALPEG